jgi:16S rRNA (guanine(966)-N(2))-methyltransferase RsmD
MRIIGGHLRGRQILVPRNFRGRPTTDFAREGLFNVLRTYDMPEGCEVLELFAGTGVFSLECLSRGALHTVSVDIAVPHVKAIRQNADAFGFRQAEVFKADVMKWLPQCGRSFDLAFADPPFDLIQLPLLPSLVRNAGVVKDNGMFVLEHPDTISFENEPGFLRVKNYGNVYFSFFRN